MADIKRLPGRAAYRKAILKAKKTKRIPEWVSMEQREVIRKKYLIAAVLSVATGKSYNIDHIVPLLGENVSGLHVPWNLQIMLTEANCSKGNRYE